jgi:hypothetical protein
MEDNDFGIEQKLTSIKALLDRIEGSLDSVRTETSPTIQFTESETLTKNSYSPLRVSRSIGDLASPSDPIMVQETPCHADFASSSVYQGAARPDEFVEMG